MQTGRFCGLLAFPPRATFLISICVLAITHGFGVQPPPPPQPPPQPPLPPTQLPPSPDLEALPPAPPQPQIQPSVHAQPEAQTPAPSHMQAPTMAPSQAATSLLPQQSQAPPAVDFASSGSLQEDWNQTQSQSFVTSEPLTHAPFPNMSIAVFPELDPLNITVPKPFFTQDLTLSEQTAETPRLIETQTLRLATLPPPLLATRPWLTAKPLILPHSESSQPGPATGGPLTLDLQPKLMTTIKAPEEERIYITEKPWVMQTEKPAVYEQLVIQLFMGLPVSCYSDPLMSCVDRCGKGTTSRAAQLEDSGPNFFQEIMAKGTSYTCKCDRYCMLYGDCCTDYFTTCRGMNSDAQIVQLRSSTQQNAEHPSVTLGEDPLLWAATLYMTYGSCQETSFIYEDVQESHMIWMISSCPETFTDHHYGGEIVQQCQNDTRRRLFSYPVSHRWFSHLIYKNIYCAMCHGVAMQDVLFWRVVLYCYNSRKDAADYSFEDILSTAESSDKCPVKSGARLPETVEFRTCRGLNVSSPDEHFGGPYSTGCQEDDPGLDPDKEAKIRAACLSVFKPVWNASRSLTFSSIYCAACSGRSSEVPMPPTCRSISSPPGQRQTEGIFAEVGHSEGYITVDMTNSQSMHGLSCSFDYPTDPRTVFMQRCPLTKCPQDVRFSENLTQMDMSCSIERFQYLGKYWEEFPPRDFKGDLILTLSKTLWAIFRPLTTELDYFSTAFRDALEKQCGYKCPTDPNLVTIFQSISLHTQGQFRAEFLFSDRLAKVFPLLTDVDRHVVRFGMGLTTLQNYHEVMDVCHTDPSLAIVIFDIPIVFHYFKVYAHVNLWGIDCFFDLERIGYFLEFSAIDGPPKTALSIVLCWNEDMAIMCKIPRPSSVGTTDDGIVHAPAPCDPSSVALAGTPIENTSLGTVTPQSNNNGHRPDSRAHTHTKDDVTLEETKVFKTVCFTVCAVASLLSGVFNLVSSTGSGKYLLMKLLICVSKLSLAVSMALYIVELNVSHTDDKLMAIFMHCTWLLTCVSLAAAFQHFQIPANINIRETSPLNTSKLVKRFAFALLIPLVIVALCVIMEEDSGSDKSVGYSSSSGHLFWMTNRNGCYISTVAVIGLTFAAVILKLSFQGLKFLRMRYESRNVESIDVRKNRKEHSNAPDEKSESTALMTFLAHLFSMYIAAVADYADSNRTLWKLLFCVASSSMGLSMLVLLCKNLFNKFGCIAHPFVCGESADVNSRCSSPGLDLGRAEHGHDCSGLEDGVRESTKSTTASSVIYSPE